MSDELSNFTVTARLEIRATDAEAALGQVAEGIRRGKLKGMAPVGSFDVAEGAPKLLDKAYPMTPEGQRCGGKPGEPLSVDSGIPPCDPEGCACERVTCPGCPDCEQGERTTG